jgi:hypothetical protein
MANTETVLQTVKQSGKRQTAGTQDEGIFKAVDQAVSSGRKS